MVEKFDKVFELIGLVMVKEIFIYVNEGGIVCVMGLFGNQWILEYFDLIIDIVLGVYLIGGYLGVVIEEKINEFFFYLQRYQVVVKFDCIFVFRDLLVVYVYFVFGQSMGKVVIDVDV